MRTEKLTESQPKVLRLSSLEAEGLQKIGRDLASAKSWWGDTGINAEESSDSSVLSCHRVEPDHWLVTVANAVGIISVGSLQIVVEPKIPPSHLLYLFQKSGRFPRLDHRHRAAAAQSNSLWELVAHWYIMTCEVLLHRDLIRDYTLTVDHLRSIRGRVSPVVAVTAAYRGSLNFRCEFDEFSIDTPLNRTLKAAARLVATSTLLRLNIRQGAARLLARMSDVGPMTPSDSFASVDRRTGHYTDAWMLAKHILRGQGRVLTEGEALVWTFLIPTPQMIEEGLRAILASELHPRWKVIKRGIKLSGSSLTFTPDLLFNNGLAVGDVKYKLATPGWRRSDLYQILAFATAFQSRNGIVYSFSTSPTDLDPVELTIGDKHVTALVWDSDLAMPPEVSAEILVNRTDRWLSAWRGDANS